VVGERLLLVEGLDEVRLPTQQCFHERIGRNLELQHMVRSIRSGAGREIVLRYGFEYGREPAGGESPHRP
jgi:hypothetical protein